MDKPKLEMFGRYLFGASGSNPPVSAKVVEMAAGYVKVKLDHPGEGQNKFAWAKECDIVVLAKLDNCPGH